MVAGTDSAQRTSVRAHYDRQALGYHARFTSGLLGAVRAREWAVLRERLAPARGESLLDAGCGPGIYARRLLALGLDVRGVDLSPKMVEAAQRAGIAASVAELAELALDAEFDAILCAGVLEFTVDPARVLGRLALHLRPGGRLVLLYPMPSLLGRLYRRHHARAGVRVRLFEQDELDELLRSASLSPTRHRWATPMSAVVRAVRA
ncbi:MAG: class I SAM-dependent methyltransferase [Myxococcales bacterium]|nr:class I SAM-dependent methyltransferase [Myxococcales bacterium]